MNILSPEHIEALKQTPHGLRFLQRVAEALDEYLRADENQQILDNIIDFGAGGISMDEAARNLSRFAISPIFDLQYNDEIVDNLTV